MNAASPLRGSRKTTGMRHLVLDRRLLTVRARRT